MVNHNLKNIIKNRNKASMEEDNMEDKNRVCIQKHIRAKLCRIQIKKTIKKLHTRRYVIEELINS